MCLSIANEPGPLPASRASYQFTNASTSAIGRSYSFSVPLINVTVSSARSLDGCSGVAVGFGVAVGTGVAEGVGVTVAVGSGVAVGEGLGVGETVGSGVAVGVAVGVGDGSRKGLVVEMFVVFPVLPVELVHDTFVRVAPALSVTCMYRITYIECAFIKLPLKGIGEPTEY